MIEPPDKDSAIGSSHTGSLTFTAGSLTPPSTTSSTSTLSDVTEFSKAQLLSQIHAYEETIESVEKDHIQVDSGKNDHDFFVQKYKKFDKTTIIEKLPSGATDFILNYADERNLPRVRKKLAQKSGGYDNSFENTDQNTDPKLEPTTTPVYQNFENHSQPPTTFEKILEKQRVFSQTNLYYTNEGIGYHAKTAKTVRTKTVKLKHREQAETQVKHPALPPKKESKLTIYHNNRKLSKDVDLISNRNSTGIGRICDKLGVNDTKSGLDRDKLSHSGSNNYAINQTNNHTKNQANQQNTQHHHAIAQQYSNPPFQQNFQQNPTNNYLNHIPHSSNDRHSNSYINYSLEQKLQPFNKTSTTKATPKVHFNEMAKVKLIEPNSKQQAKLKAQLTYIKKNHKNIWSQGTHIFIDSDQECGSYSNNLETCSNISTMSGLRRKIERMHRKTRKTKNRLNKAEGEAGRTGCPNDFVGSEFGGGQQVVNENRSFLAYSMPDLDKLENQSLPDLDRLKQKQFRISNPKVRNQKIQSQHFQNSQYQNTHPSSETPVYSRSNSSNSAFFSKLKTKIKSFV